jgi:hypothetical protein
MTFDVDDVKNNCLSVDVTEEEPTKSCVNANDANAEADSFVSKMKDEE